MADSCATGAKVFNVYLIALLSKSIELGQVQFFGCLGIRCFELRLALALVFEGAVCLWARLFGGAIGLGLLLSLGFMRLCLDLLGGCCFGFSLLLGVKAFFALVLMPALFKFFVAFL